MKKYLVIGNPVDHSLSPRIHNYWMKKHLLVDSIYEKRALEKKDLKNLIKEIISKIRNFRLGQKTSDL